MDTETPALGWLLLLAQLPSSPSSARVALWRRLRAIGATGVLNGAWMLPSAEPHAEFFERLRETVHGQGGTAFMFTVSAPSGDVNETIVRRFRADRSREYDEFAERCAAFLDEIGKETRAGKFTFAELEESEQDLEKLARWLPKIQARDFFPDERWPQSAEMVERCRVVLEGFAWKVYASEGVQASAEDASSEGAGAAKGDSARTPAGAPEPPSGGQAPRSQPSSASREATSDWRLGPLPYCGTPVRTPGGFAPIRTLRRRRGRLPGRGRWW